MKLFTDKDLHEHSGSVAGVIICDRRDLIYNPPKWMRLGLQETASGYGARLNSGFSINYGGKQYRIYNTCYGNAGSLWFKVKGVKIFVHA